MPRREPLARPGRQRALARLVLLALCSAGLGCGADGHLTVPPTADSCGSCHVEQLAEWSGSSHARSAESPVFRALLPRVEDAWGGDAAAACVSCHSPGHGGDDAIGCVSCHAAVGHGGVRDGQLHVSLDAPLMGPRGNVFTDAHRSRRSDLLRSPELCGTCHEVTGPGLFVEPTFSEWQDSGVTTPCVDCHLDGHHLRGFDPPWGADLATRTAAQKRTRTLLRQALALDVDCADGSCTITLTNRGAGHVVPTGVGFLRDIWLEVRWPDGAIARLTELGSLSTRSGVPVVLPTDADTIVHRGLAPGERRVLTVAHRPGATLSLRAQAIRADILDALGLGSRAAEVPIHTLYDVVIPPTQ